MAERTALGLHTRRDPADARVRRIEEIGPRGVDGELLAERVELRDDVEGVLAETGRMIADDGRVDGDARSLAHAESIGEGASTRA